MPRRDPEARRAADREKKRRKRWREGRAFRCAQCLARFSGRREAWQLRDGRRVRLGVCSFCGDAVKRAA